MIQTPLRFSELIVVIIAIAVVGSTAQQDLIVVDGFVDPAACYASMQAADINEDGRIQDSEYVDFATILAPAGTLDNIQTFSALPLALQSTFGTLACLCRDERFGGDASSSNANCCVGPDRNIPIVGQGSTSSPQDGALLFATCFLTDQAIAQVVGSLPPTASPTKPPTPAPTPVITPPPVPPTDAPIAVTPEPTPEPTPAPTPEPTPAVTPDPTPEPTPEITPAPTAAPIAPTPPPTTAPVTPTPPPTGIVPTATPTTLAPFPTSIAPTTAVVVQIVYTIAIQDGTLDQVPQSSYVSDLIAAMDILATDTLVQLNSNGRRRLVVSVKLPTDIADLEENACPVDRGLATDDDRCENVAADITLVDEGLISSEFPDTFDSALFSAIVEGGLQTALDQVNSDSVVRILTGLTAPIPRVDSSLGAGATAGIILVALGATILPIVIYLLMRREPSEKPDMQGYSPTPSDEKALSSGPSFDVQSTQTDGNTLAAKAGDFYETPVRSQKKDKVPSPSRSASSAGSSGWSSSAGLSSYENAGSNDDSVDLPSPPPSAKKPTAAAAAITKKVQTISPPPSPSPSETDAIAKAKVSRADLDNAIEQGDWAAVGATAAMLASADDSQSQDSRKSHDSKSKTSQSKATTLSSADAARAAELDHLVDAGDWEGVVLAAAKFEAAEAGTEGGVSSSATASEKDSSQSVGSMTNSGTFDQSNSTESPSRAQKRDTIRKEVAELVQRVVPEEYDNIDEMMHQFRGREEELVETLRTMQERAVAQKARQSAQRKAKTDARRNVQRGVVPGVSPPTSQSSPNTSSAAEGGQSMNEDSMTSPPTEAVSSMASTTVVSSTEDYDAEAEAEAEQKRTALEAAIASGDWEAVGEAAALMAETSFSGSRLTDNIQDDSLRSSTIDGSSVVPGTTGARAEELDKLVDQGDWDGVVAAVQKYTRADQEADSVSTRANNEEEEMDATDEAAEKRSRQLQEEENALAEAAMWEQIAEQSRSEGATDEAASDATQWAIARSLSRMQQEENAADAEDGTGGVQGPGEAKLGDNESV